MAKAILHEPSAAKLGPDAHDELEKLLQTLHESGTLRLLNDIVSARHPVAKTLVDGLNSAGTMNAVQNVAILFMALSRIHPNDFYRIVHAIKALVEGAATPLADATGAAPGVSGAWKMLHDDELWAAVWPLLAGLKAFSDESGREVFNPISAFSGKRGEP